MRLINMNRALENGLFVSKRLLRTKARDFFRRLINVVEACRLFN